MVSKDLSNCLDKGFDGFVDVIMNGRPTGNYTDGMIGVPGNIVCIGTAKCSVIVDICTDDEVGVKNLVRWLVASSYFKVNTTWDDENTKAFKFDYVLKTEGAYVLNDPEKFKATEFGNGDFSGCAEFETAEQCERFVKELFCSGIKVNSENYELLRKLGSAAEMLVEDINTARNNRLHPFDEICAGTIFSLECKR